MNIKEFKKQALSYERYAEVLEGTMEGDDYYGGQRNAWANFKELIDQLDEPEKDKEIKRLKSELKNANQDIAILQKIYSEKKVIIPQFVGEWIERLRYSGLNFYSAYEYAREFKQADDKTRKWLNSEDNLEDFARAWLYGYAVEEKPQWVVAFEFESGAKAYFDRFSSYENEPFNAVTIPGLGNAYKFDSEDKARAVALLIGGTAEEVQP